MRDLFNEWLDSFELWEEQVFEDPAYSVTVASQLRRLTETIFQLLQGRILLILGASWFHTGDIESAEDCFQGAEMALRDYPVDRAEAKRNLAAVRANQGSKTEALRLLKEASSLLTAVNAPPSETGRVLVQKGAVHERFEELPEAATDYLDACRHLNRGDRHYTIALNNCMHVLVKLRWKGDAQGFIEIQRISAAIDTIRGTLSPRSAITTIVDWLRYICSICDGNPRHAISKLPDLRARLLRHEYPEVALGLLEIDLAQAHFLLNDNVEATEALRRAAIYLPTIENRIDRYIERIRKGDKAEPWDLHSLANLRTVPNDRKQRPDLARPILQALGAVIPRMLGRDGKVR